MICSSFDMSCCVNITCRYSLIEESGGEYHCIFAYIRNGVVESRPKISKYFRITPQRIKQIEEHSLRRIRKKSVVESYKNKNS